MAEHEQFHGIGIKAKNELDPNSLSRKGCGESLQCEPGGVT